MLSRRQFLKMAGATAAVAVPSLTGYALFREEQGESPPSLSPYAAINKREGPSSSAPILIATGEQTDNPFGIYLAEILRAEGLNCFAVERLSAIDTVLLSHVDVVLLAECSLTTEQFELLESYVANGGGLVAMRPDARLTPLLGLEPLTGTTAEGYIAVDRQQPVGQGIAGEKLQFHGAASHYRLAGAQAAAWLLSPADSPMDYPAVTLHTYGRGQAGMWAFDLARSIAYTRQGNPAWVDQERDALAGVRPGDMFKGWVDLERLEIPQADEQQRLLANMLSMMSRATRPLPRLWYFPGTAVGMLIATSDSHQNQAFAVDDVLTRVEQRGGHMSVYYSPQTTDRWRRIARKARWWAAELPLLGSAVANPTAFPSPSVIAGWRARGHEFSLHPNVDDGVTAGWHRCWKEFTNLGYGPVSRTVRTHQVLWEGWVETARAQATYGIRMNLDYYQVGPAFQDEHGAWAYGHFTGSALPMKFVDERGQVLDIYQQLTQLADEHLIDVPWGTFADLSADEAVEVSEMLLNQALHGTPCVVVGNFHVDPFAESAAYIARAGRWLEGTLDHAAANSIPIWSAEEWLRFTETRHDAVLDGVQWDPSTGQLNFQITSPPAQGIDLTVMIPAEHAAKGVAHMSVDGSAVPFNERTVGGIRYAWTSVEAGSHQISGMYG